MSSVRRSTGLLLVVQKNLIHQISMDYSLRHFLLIGLVAGVGCRASQTESDRLGFTRNYLFCSKARYPKSYDFNVSCLKSIQGLEFRAIYNAEFTYKRRYKMIAYLGIHRAWRSHVHLTLYKIGKWKW